MGFRAGRRPGWHVAAPVLLAVVAGGFRLWGLSEPDRTYWDESYYVVDASAYLGGGFGIPIDHPPDVRITSEATWVHPPLGKWIIALLGVGPFGVSSFGARFPSALFGVAGILLVYALALELWGSVGWASLAGGALALDGLHIVQSRIGMLDVFTTTFVTAGVWFVVRDRRRHAERSGGIASIFGSTDRLLAGLAFGAAVACKWSGLPGLLFGASLATVWTLRRSEGERARAVRTLVASFVILPAFVYIVSYGSFWYEHGPDVPAFVTLQVRMFDHGVGHIHAQPENSAPITWPLLLHPIRYFPAAAIHPDPDREVLLVGNPVIWWGFLVLAPLLPWNALRRKRWQDAVVVGGYLAMYGPWFVLARTQFLYYMLPAVPFMALGLTSVLRDLPQSIRPWITGAVAAAILLAAAAFAPAWMALPSSHAWLNGLRLLPGWPPAP